MHLSNHACCQWYTLLQLLCTRYNLRSVDPFPSLYKRAKEPKSFIEMCSLSALEKKNASTCNLIPPSLCVITPWNIPMGLSLVNLFPRPPIIIPHIRIDHPGWYIERSLILHLLDCCIIGSRNEHDTKDYCQTNLDPLKTWIHVLIKCLLSSRHVWTCVLAS